MKKTLTIVAAIAVSLAMASPGFAQMKETAGQAVQSDRAADIKSDMSALLTDMSGMLAQMATMAKDVSPRNRKKLSGVMHSLSLEMANMSGMMGSGSVSDRALEKTRVRLMKIQRVLTEMQRTP